ncbi:phage tail tape measure protein [Paludibacter sp.]|uniref:phage tail tape measure protein n=1 Tax=Paludibacter sp. TaxID=1898105 RepID=UPI0013539C49|nr:phage tail tape measure protein [Paludibacter sp.]MTK53283.1 phage tail tape measure protein [Paludibacter sp.]
MAGGIAKLQLLIDLKNNLSAGLDKAKKMVDKSCGGMQDKLSSLKSKNIEVFDAIKSEVPGVGSALSMLTNPYVAIAAAVVALGVAYYQCVDMALNWQQGLAKINVTAQLSQKELGNLSDKLLEIGERNVAPIEQIPDAFNKIISAGLDVNTSLKVLEPTLRAAKAGFTDVGVTADAAVGVMNASGRNINTVYDALFATVNKGKAEFKDVAQYLPKIIPGARSAGLALEETAGAWAFLTAHGMTAERATTLAENAFKSLADPSKIKAFKKLGISLYDSQGQIKPLINIIDQLSVKTKNMSDLSRAKFFGKIGLDMEAASFFSSATQDMKGLRETIDFVTNSQGQLNEAYKNSMTPLDNFHIIQNMIKGTMIEIGQSALPLINSLGQGILDMINWFKNLWNTSAAFRDIIGFIGTVAKFSFNMALVPMKAIVGWFQVLGGIINWVISLIPGMSGGFTTMYNKIRPYLVWIKEFLTGILQVLRGIVTFNMNDIKGGVNSIRNMSIDEIRKKLAADDKTHQLKAQGKADQLTDANANGVPDATEGTGKKGNDNSFASSAAGADAKTISRGSQTKNTTINIGSFIDKFSPQSQSINGMNRDELERWLTEMFMRVVRSAELAN